MKTRAGVRVLTLGVLVLALAWPALAAETAPAGAEEKAPPTISTDRWGPAVGVTDGLPEIKSVAIGPNREFLVNGKPFLPIMGWLQDPVNLPKLKAVGINTIVGYWRPAEGEKGTTKGADQYAEYAKKAGLYFVPIFDAKYMDEMKVLKDSPVVLAWIQEDEPDLPETVSDAQVTPVSKLIINKSTPLWGMIDGVTHSWSVLDPLEGAEVKFTFNEPRTVQNLAVWLTISAKLSVAKEISFGGDGKEILRVALENKSGQQKFNLKEPATFRELSFKVLSVVPGEEKWGSICEIEGFAKDGRNVLIAPPRKVPRETPEQVMERYKALKALDAMRPIMMTVSCFYINDPTFANWWKHEQADRLYPELFKAADIPGFDVYPIYGWNRPDKLAWVTQGVKELRAYAGRQKPTYVWLECLKGARFKDSKNEVTGREIRNEVWQAVIQGANAVGYFTHYFGEGPEFKEFGPPPENQKAMLAINRQLAQLARVITGPDAKVQPKMELEGGLPAQCLAKEAGGELYIFAQNIDAGLKTGRGTISVESLKAGTRVAVVDDNREISAEDGKFVDDFGPLAVHIYRLRL